MNSLFRKCVAFLLSDLLILLPMTGCAARRTLAPPPPVLRYTLRGYLQKSYLELFEIAPALRFSAAEFQAQRQAF